MTYKFYLNSTLVTNPLNWEDAIETTVSLSDDFGITITQDVDFEINGDGYDLLRELFVNGFCNEADVRITREVSGNETEIYTGVIKVPEVKWFLETRTCKFKVQDNSFYRFINNNKNIITPVNVGRSKNDLVIDVADDDSVQIYNPCGNVLFDTMPMYSVYECFKFIVAFCSDNEMEFDSPYFGAGGNGEYWYLQRGEALRRGGVDYSTSKRPELSFSKLLRGIQAQEELGYYIDNTGVKPKLIIDLESNLRKSDVGLNTGDVRNIEQFVDVNKLYGTVKVGGQSVEPVVSGCPDESFPQTIFFGFSEETFGLSGGQCNTNLELDITNTFIVDNNILHKVIIASDDGYDDDVFLIKCHLDSIPLLRTENTDIFSSGDYFYNNVFRNNMLLQRKLQSVPYSLSKYLSANNGFLAVTQNPVLPPGVFVSFSPGTNGTKTEWVFDDDYSDGFDPNNVWGNGTTQGNPVTAGNSLFTAPFDGYYSFEIKIGCIRRTFGSNSVPFSYPVLDWVSDVGNIIGITVTIDKEYTYDTVFVISQYFLTGQQASVTFLNEYQVYYPSPPLPGLNYQNARIMKDPRFDGGVNWNTTIRTIQDDSGGEYQYYDPNNSLLVINRFKTTLTDEQWQAYIADPLKKITATSFGENYSGHIKKIRYNNVTGETSVEIRTSINNL